jgi:hypothetical protein
MHSLRTKNGTLFHFNSDLSGEVIVRNSPAGDELHVNGEDLVEFVVDFVRRKRIAALEEMSDEIVLGIPPKGR